MPEKTTETVTGAPNMAVSQVALVGAATLLAAARPTRVSISVRLFLPGGVAASVTIGQDPATVAISGFNLPAIDGDIGAAGQAYGITLEYSGALYAANGGGTAYVLELYN